MACLTVKWAPMASGTENIKNLSGRIDQAVDSIYSIRSSLSFSTGSAYEMKRRLLAISEDLSRQSQSLRAMGNVLAKARSRYMAAENKICGDRSESETDKGGGKDTVSPETSILANFLTPLLGKFGIAGKTAVIWLTLMDDGKSGVEKGIAVGKNGVGMAGVIGSWMKSGMKGDEALDFFLGINTKNIEKGISFWDAFKKEASSYVFENGDDMTKAARVGDKISVGAKWAGGILTLAGSAVGNYSEYKSGDISGGRAVAETVMETAVDIGADMAISAGVTAAAAALGVTAAPAIAVAGVTVVAKWGLDCVCESIWGKSFTETTSDFVLDTGEKLVSGAKDLAKGAADVASDMAKGAGKVCDAVADTVGKTAKAVKGGLKSAWKSATKWAFG